MSCSLSHASDPRSLFPPGGRAQISFAAAGVKSVLFPSLRLSCLVHCSGFLFCFCLGRGRYHRPGCRSQFLLPVVELLPDLKFLVHGSRSRLIKGSHARVWSSAKVCLGFADLLVPSCASTMNSISNPVLRANSFSIAMWS
jgi:hypothetical protein